MPMPMLISSRTSSLRPLLLAACLSLAAVASHAADAPEPVTVDAGFRPAEQAGKLLKVAEGQALKGLKKVAVPLFSVEFVTADSERAENSGFGNVGRSSASVAFQLKGVEEPDFAAITQALYNGFVADLQAAGLEVLTQEQVAASPTYRKLAAGGVPSPIKSSDAITLAPAGMAIYGFNKVQSGGSGSSSKLFGALAQMGSGFSAVGAAMDGPAVQQELGAALLEVQLKVSFVQLNNLSKGFLGRLSGSSQVAYEVRPMVASATFSVQSGTRGSLTLTQPLALDKAAIAEVRTVPTSTAEKAGLVAVAILSVAIGGNSSTSSDAKEAVADPARYREIVGGGLSQATQMFVARLKKGE